MIPIKQQTINSGLLVLLAFAFFANAYADVQRQDHTVEKIHELNQTDVYLSDELEHQRERRQRLAGRVLFLEDDLEDVLGPNWTYVDEDDQISVTSCERVSSFELQCNVTRDFREKAGEEQ